MKLFENRRNEKRRERITAALRELRVNEKRRGRELRGWERKRKRLVESVREAHRSGRKLEVDDGWQQIQHLGALCANLRREREVDHLRQIALRRALDSLEDGERKRSAGLKASEWARELSTVDPLRSEIENERELDGWKELARPDDEEEPARDEAAEKAWFFAELERGGDEPALPERASNRRPKSPERDASSSLLDQLDAFTAESPRSSS